MPAGTPATDATSGATPAPCGPLDIALVPDVTGSMGPAVENTKIELASIMDEVERASGGDYRFSVVSFRDDVIVDVPFAPQNRDEAERALRGLFAIGGNSGGEGEPEASQEGLRTAVLGLPVGRAAPDR